MTVASAVYQAIIHELEALERSGAYQGNAHHLAQRLAEQVQESSQLVTTEEAGQELARVVSSVTGKKVAYFGG